MIITGCVSENAIVVVVVGSLFRPRILILEPGYEVMGHVMDLGVNHIIWGAADSE